MKDEGEAGVSGQCGAVQAQVIVSEELAPELAPLSAVIEGDPIQRGGLCLGKSWAGVDGGVQRSRRAGLWKIAIGQDRWAQAHYPPPLVDMRCL